MMPDTIKGLREIKADDMDIVIRLKKLGQHVMKIYDCCSGRFQASWTKGKLIVKEVIVVRVNEDSIEEVHDDQFFHKSGAIIGVMEMDL